MMKCTQVANTKLSSPKTYVHIDAEQVLSFIFMYLEIMYLQIKKLINKDF